MTAASPEDTTIVRQVLAAGNNYYKVLGVTMTATDVDIKLAYKKLAIKCHPDRNRDPRATDAFKSINTANAVLSDPEKRRVYDNHGAEGVQRQESTGSPHARPQRRAHPQMDPEDLFEFFPFMPRPRQRGGPGGPAGGQEVHMNVNLMFIFPLILFFFFMMVMQGGGSHMSGDHNHGYASSRHLFSLSQSRDEGYVIKRDTAYLSDRGLHAMYYVRGNFGDTLRRYGLSLRNVEHEVLRSHKESLERRCVAELKRRQREGRTGENQPAVCMEYDRFQRFLG